MAQWDKLLKSLGFTESEAKIYLKSLEIGAASVQDLAKKSRVSRVTTYAVIETLTVQGLMSSVEKGKKKLYVAESPDRLVSVVHSKVKTMEATLKEIQASLHDLKMIQRGEKPVVKLFEGPEALKAIQDDVLQTRPKHMDEFGNLDEIRRLYKPEDREVFFHEVKKFLPKTRAIFLSQEVKPISRGSHEEIALLPVDKFNFSGDVFVYGNKVALSTFRGKQISVLIESEELVKTFRAMFEYLWHCMAHLPVDSFNKVKPRE